VAVIFPRWTNHLPTAVALAAPVVLITVIGVVWYWFSPEFLDVGYQPKQPIPFSHRLHAGEMGMDCRYCHSTAEWSAFAAVPENAICMNCHSVVKADSPKLEPLRESVAGGEALAWTRVHMLPDYAFYDHSVHLAAGVGCATCHGRIDQMEVVAQQEPLSMDWCLACHRDPGPNLRPPSEITNMAWSAEASGYHRETDADGRPLSADGKRTLQPPNHCSGCHR
jgi:hypothetical protein